MDSKTKKKSKENKETIETQKDVFEDYMLYINSILDVLFNSFLDI